jgi:hypothetical protein
MGLTSVSVGKHVTTENFDGAMDRRRADYLWRRPEFSADKTVTRIERDTRKNAHRVEAQQKERKDTGIGNADLTRSPGQARGGFDRAVGKVVIRVHRDPMLRIVHGDGKQTIEAKFVASERAAVIEEDEPDGELTDETVDREVRHRGRALCLRAPGQHNTIRDLAHSVICPLLP